MDIITASIAQKDKFLKNYHEISMSRASEFDGLQIGDVDLWTSTAGGVYVHVPLKRLLEQYQRPSNGSACRVVLCRLLGVSHEEYERILRKKGDLKIYKHNTKNKFAVVYMIPQAVLKNNPKMWALYTTLATATIVTLGAISMKLHKTNKVDSYPEAIVDLKTNTNPTYVAKKRLKVSVVKTPPLVQPFFNFILEPDLVSQINSRTMLRILKFMGEQYLGNKQNENNKDNEYLLSLGRGVLENINAKLESEKLDD